MSRTSLFLLFILSQAVAVYGQTFPVPGYFRQLVHQPSVSTQLNAPEGLRDYVAEGKLRLSLADAIRLTLLNNTEVRLNQTSIDQARFALEHTYQPFDPSVLTSFNPVRSTQPSYTQLSGAPTLSSLNQPASLHYSQMFQTGTLYQADFSANKLSTNSSFYFFNPSIFSTLDCSLTQPLLRNRGLFPNRALIVIAQRNLSQSRATFEANVNLSIAQAVVQYWSVVQARESLEVQRQSLEEAEASYKRDKRGLELGALPPLDIYRSESEVAARRVQVIQAEYFLKQTEDTLRRII